MTIPVTDAAVEALVSNFLRRLYGSLSHTPNAHAIESMQLALAETGFAVTHEARMLSVHTGKLVDDWRRVASAQFHEAGGQAHEGRDFRVEYRTAYTLRHPTPGREGQS